MLNDNFVTFEIGKAKHIALVAHDGKKKELIEVLENYDQEQSKQQEDRIKIAIDAGHQTNGATRIRKS